MIAVIGAKEWHDLFNYENLIPYPLLLYAGLAPAIVIYLYNPEKIYVLSKSWGVLSEKIFNKDGTYLINHSSSILLLSKGKYIDRISHHENVNNIFKIIKSYL